VENLVSLGVKICLSGYSRVFKEDFTPLAINLHSLSKRYSSHFYVRETAK
jgi:hypothetical protein